METCKDCFAQQGWECPKCGRVYSPSTSMCMYCGNESVSVNTNTSAIPIDFSAMCDMTEEELSKYQQILDGQYKPTGLNLCDIGIKNNYNKIKQFNKNELTEFIVDLANYAKHPCAFCGYYDSRDDECLKDCYKGVKIWLEREAE